MNFTEQSVVENWYKERVIQLFDLSSLSSSHSSSLSSDNGNGNSSSQLLPFIDMQEIFGMVQYSKLRMHRQKSHAFIQPLYRLAIDSDHPATTRLRGDELIDKAKLFISKIRPPPTDFQHDIMALTLELVSRAIYQNEWDLYEPLIRKRNGWYLKHEEIAFVKAGRQEGKSTGVGMAIATILYILPNANIPIFSCKQDQSSIILDHARKIWTAHPMTEDIEAKITSSQQILVNMGRGDTRKAKAYPGQVSIQKDNGYRGGEGRIGARCPPPLCVCIKKKFLTILVSAKKP